MGGYETPSEPGTPEPQTDHAVSYWNQEDFQAQPGIEHWDWKTDAPEFVPGGAMKSDEVAVFPLQNWNPGDAMSNGQDPVRQVQLRSHFEWQMRSKGDELREMQNRLTQLELETAQVRAAWETERRNLVRQIGSYRSVLERYCIPVEEASGASYRAEGVVVEPPTAESKLHDEFRVSNELPANTSWMNGCAGSQEANGFGAGNFGNAQQFFVPGMSAITLPSAGLVDEPEQVDSSLDCKMRLLNTLLQEGQSSKRQVVPPPPPHPQAAIQACQPAEPEETKDGHEAIASTLRAMFPHATIRTGRADLDSEEVESPEPAREEALIPSVQSLLFQQRDLDTPLAELETLSVEQHTRRLERLTNSTVDERAMRSMVSLGQKDAKAALCTVDELVQAQGGHCRNLSSILQSVCRKIEKRGRPPKHEDRPFSVESFIDYSTMPSGAVANFRKPARTDDAAEAFESEATSWPALGTSKGRPEVSSLSRANSNATQPVDTPAGKRSWADIKDGSDHEDEAEEPLPPVEDGWTTRWVDEIARKGFELKRKGDRWEFKLSMAQLDPKPTDAGMEKYCQWLRVRLKAFREEHGVEPLRRCRGEIDFSNNRLTNEMVWMLLETLAQHQVHAAVVKLQGNEISQGGVLAICEFIRTNDPAEAVYELNLSDNEIDDDAALELLRTFADERTRYPPKRIIDGCKDEVKVPVWLQLSHNRIVDPEGLKRMAEVEAITICDASDRNACGFNKCLRRDCPQVHLYGFNLQGESREAPEGGKGGKTRSTA